MTYRINCLVFAVLLLSFASLGAQEVLNSNLLSIDRIVSGEFMQDTERTIQWIKNGEHFVTIEKSASLPNADELILYNSSTQKKVLFVPAEALIVENNSLPIDSFSLSPN